MPTYIVTMRAEIRLEIEAPDQATAREAVDYAFRPAAISDPLNGCMMNLDHGDIDGLAMVIDCKTIQRCTSTKGES